VSVAQELRSKTVKELAAEAKHASIVGWHAMRKEELVAALVKFTKKQQNGKHTIEKTSPKKKDTTTPAKKDSEKIANFVKKSPSAPKVKISSQLLKKDPLKKDSLPSEKPMSPESHQRIHRLKESLTRYREMSGIYEGSHKDRLILMVRDPFWLHAYWELSTKLIERARAAMGAYWHTAVPVLRLYRLMSDGLAQPRREFVRDIRLHGSVNNWYIDVHDPPATFLVEIGYLSSKKQFFPLASSNFVETPESHVFDTAEKIDGNWLDVSKEFDRIFRLSGGLNKNTELKEVFEKQLKRSMSLPNFSRFSENSRNGRTLRDSLLAMEADLVIYGTTESDVQLTVKGEPVRVMPDGTFFIRFTLPEKRHVYPVVATSADGIETQTVILAIERNTKVLETVFRENEDEE